MHLTSKKQELEQRLAALQTRKAATATVSQPDPAPTAVPVDPESADIERRAQEILEHFERRSKESAPDTPTPAQTMSLTDREHQMLRDQKEAQARAVAAEKKAERLEQTLMYVAEHLATFIIEQSRNQS